MINCYFMHLYCSCRFMFRCVLTHCHKGHLMTFLAAIVLILPLKWLLDAQGKSIDVLHRQSQ